MFYLLQCLFIDSSLLLKGVVLKYKASQPQSLILFLIQRLKNVYSTLTYYTSSIIGALIVDQVNQFCSNIVS